MTGINFQENPSSGGRYTDEEAHCSSNKVPIIIEQLKNYIKFVCGACVESARYDVSGKFFQSKARHSRIGTLFFKCSAMNGVSEIFSNGGRYTAEKVLCFPSKLLLIRDRSRPNLILQSACIGSVRF
jgi:hypothetical protein